MWGAVSILWSGLHAGCLNEIVPGHWDAGVTVDLATPAQATPDPGGGGGGPVADGGVPLFAYIQAGLDEKGCTASSCHSPAADGGAAANPIWWPSAKGGNLRANFNDFIVGCTMGAPDPADCLNASDLTQSLVLTKPLATSGVTHMGGKQFKDANDPTYQLWLSWIQSGAQF